MAPRPRPVKSLVTLAALVVAVMAGCAGSGGVQPVARAETKDRVTASDEPESMRRARVRLELASAYFARGQVTVALDEVKLAIAADPSLSEAFNLRGLIYANLGDERLAEESFRNALLLNPRDADAMQNFGWYLCQLKRYPEADSLFRQALGVPQYRDSARTLLAQGLCQAYAGNLPQAESTLLQSLQLAPGNPSTSYHLAEVLYRRGQYERAQGYLQRVNGMADMASAETLWLAIRIEHRLGDGPATQALGRRLISGFPSSREATAFQKGAFDE